MNRYICFLAGMILSTFVSYSQSIPVTTKIGKVSLEECQLSSFPQDTTAEVVVLWQKKEVRVDFESTTGKVRRFQTFIERVKILKEEGKEWGTGSVEYSTDPSAKEHVSKVQVTTYNAEDGKVVATKLPKSEIVREKVRENVDRISYAALNVKVGSVVEVSYELDSDIYYLIPDYYFQRSVPVNLSEYEFYYPQWLIVSKDYRGYHPVSYGSSELNGDNFLNGDIYRAVDVPAMKADSHSFCPRQYRSAVSYTVIALNYSTYEKISVEWSDVAKAVADSPIIGKLKSPCQFKSEVDPIKNSTDESSVSKIEMIIRLVQSKIQWDENISLIPSSSSESLRGKNGSNADMNAVAGSALRYAGFNVSPVLIRMRSSGVLRKHYPSLRSFDTFILKVTDAEGKSYYVDAADRCAFVNVLDDEYLVDSGFMINRDGSFEWVDLTNVCPQSSAYRVDAILKEDGTLSGAMMINYMGLASLEAKRSLKKYEDEEKMIGFFENALSVEISDFQISGLNDFSPALRISFRFEQSNSVAGDQIILNPFMVKMHSESSFKSETRVIPVEFDHPETISYNYRLSIPEGYSVIQKPESVKYVAAFPSNVVVKCVAGENGLSLAYKYDNKSFFVPAEDYQDLRKYWADVCALYKQIIIVKKNN